MEAPLGSRANNRAAHPHRADEPFRKQARAPVSLRARSTAANRASLREEVGETDPERGLCVVPTAKLRQSTTVRHRGVPIPRCRQRFPTQLMARKQIAVVTGSVEKAWE